MRDPRQLSAGASNTVIALSETEVAKLYTGDTRSDFGSEAYKMSFANDVNDLVVKFIRIDDYDEIIAAERLVMERLYPIDYLAYETEKRQVWFEVFEDALQQLHQARFVHRDIRRPCTLDGFYFDNVLLTQTGLRLIDIGSSAGTNRRFCI